MVRTLSIAMLLFALLLCGCKASPAKPSPFLGELDGLEAVPNVETFHKFYYAPGGDWEKYKKIHVAPVNTRFLREGTAWQKASFADIDAEGVEDLADFTREVFLDAFSRYEGEDRLPVIDTP